MRKVKKKTKKTAIFAIERRRFSMLSKCAVIKVTITPKRWCVAPVFRPYFLFWTDPSPFAKLCVLSNEAEYTVASCHSSRRQTFSSTPKRTFLRKKTERGVNYDNSRRFAFATLCKALFLFFIPSTIIPQLRPTARVESFAGRGRRRLFKQREPKTCRGVRKVVCPWPPAFRNRRQSQTVCERRGGNWRTPHVGSSMEDFSSRPGRPANCCPCFLMKKRMRRTLIVRVFVVIVTQRER